ncbi:ABC transporter permease subunit [Haloarcula rubripromontorii]|uniref:ABC transporter permease subunit n=1 Tax=Haloarcula rubripromontorii TaxID=1705562 RepID=A0A847U4U7_9EURY|nr:ABC transporter permease subunit [Haloarcula rubripromontorii]NLV06208.1 ABC transporter permease subunit [Haloarcula rubripromontorii]
MWRTAYLAIADGRESGNLRLLLALEPNRRTIVVGKFLGRSAVVAAGLGIGFLLLEGLSPSGACSALVTRDQRDRPLNSRGR